MRSITPLSKKDVLFFSQLFPPPPPPPPPFSFISVFLDSFPVTLKSPGFNLGWKRL